MNENLTLNEPNGVVYNEKTACTYKGDFPENGVIEIKDGTEVIADKCFWMASNLTELIIPNSVTHIGDTAVISTSLKSLTLPESVKFVGNQAFGFNPYLETVTFKGDIEGINHLTFRFCDDLKEFILSPDVSKEIEQQLRREYPNIEIIRENKLEKNLYQGHMPEKSDLTPISIKTQPAVVGMDDFAKATKIENSPMKKDSVNEISPKEAENYFNKLKNLANEYFPTITPPEYSKDTQWVTEASNKRELISLLTNQIESDKESVSVSYNGTDLNCKIIPCSDIISVNIENKDGTEDRIALFSLCGGLEMIAYDKNLDDVIQEHNDNNHNNNDPEFNNDDLDQIF